MFSSHPGVSSISKSHHSNWLVLFRPSVQKQPTWHYIPLLLSGDRRLSQFISFAFLRCLPISPRASLHSADMQCLSILFHFSGPDYLVDFVFCPLSSQLLWLTSLERFWLLSYFPGFLQIWCQVSALNHLYQMSLWQSVHLDASKSLELVRTSLWYSFTNVDSQLRSTRRPSGNLNLIGFPYQYLVQYFHPIIRNSVKSGQLFPYRLLFCFIWARWKSDQRTFSYFNGFGDDLPSIA